jgi:hypothetical protein
MTDEEDLLPAMEVGIRYIVTRESYDGAFLVGDPIYMWGDGSVLNADSEEWMRAEQWASVARGVQVQPDAKWVVEMCEKLQRLRDELAKGDR